MSFQTVVLNGQTFYIPNPRAVDWGQKVTDFLVAIPSSVLQPDSGLFTLTEILDFGAGEGIKALYFSSREADAATDGLFRLGHDDVISWRNEANNGNLHLSVDSNDNLVWDGDTIVTTINVQDTDSIDLDWNDATSTLTADVNISGSTLDIDGSGVKVADGGITNTQVNAAAGIVYSKLNLTNSIVNADINASAAIAYSKLNLSNSIVNADINSAAAIAFSKLAALSSGNILVGSSGNVATSVAMTGDIGISNAGVTAIQPGVIVDADINAAAAITRSKLASGTAYRIVANNASGVLSENAAITASRVVLSDANGQLVANDAITASRALISDASGFPTHSVTTSTELSYVSGVTSAIQTQLDGKANRALSNLQSVAINTSLISDTDNTDDLGSDAIEWKDAWVHAIKHNDAVDANLSILTTGNNGDIIITPHGTGATIISNLETVGDFEVDGDIYAHALLLSDTSNQIVLGTTNTTTISASAPAASRTYTLPDAGGAANFLLSGWGQIVNADINAAAAIARTKTASGTAYRILANNSSGVMSENAAITASRVVLSDANGQLTANGAITAARALISDGSGFPTHSVTTATELSYVNGVTSPIQTQLDGKANRALSNLASVAINTSLLPGVDNTIDLGSGSFRWANVIANIIKAGVGAVGTPSLTFTSDTNTGFWTTGNDDLYLSTNGTLRLDVTTTINPRVNVIPNTDASLDSGSSAVRWNNIYANAFQGVNGDVFLTDTSTATEAIPQLSSLSNNGNLVAQGTIFSKVASATLVTNGNFASGTSGWTFGTGWSVSGGKALHTAGNTAALTQSITTVPGTGVVCTFTLSGRTAGSVTVTIAGTDGTPETLVSAATANQTYTSWVGVGDGTVQPLTFTPTSDFDGSIDDVSLTQWSGFTQRTGAIQVIPTRAGSGNSMLPSISFLHGSGGATGFSSPDSESIGIHINETIAASDNMSFSFSGDGLVFHHGQKIRMIPADDAFFIDVQVPATLADDWTLTLPPDAGTNGYVLTTDGAGVTTWEPGGAGGGANTALSNLASVAINTTLVSDTNNTDDLGTSSIAWKDLFLSGAIKSGGSTLATTTELGYLTGVTSAIQTQLNAKKTIATGNAYKFETTDASGNLQETTVTASRAVVTDANGLPTAATTTATEIGYVNGVTSAIQTQLNAKAATALSNLASVAINTSLISDTTNTDDLGSSSIAWKSLYLKTSLVLQETSGTTDAITISAPASVTSYSLVLPNAQGAASTVLTNDGSGNLSWAAGGGGGGMSAPVGTIIQAPSAPTGDGTWVACDGSALSQSTYSALYSAIGQSYYAYDKTQGSNFSVATAANSCVWSGSRWVIVSSSNTATYYSTDGTTWSSGGALSGSLSAPTLTSNGSGTIIAHRASTTAGRTTDHGANWAAITLPANGANIKWNGTYFILNTGSDANIYYSTTGADGSWTTASSVLLSNINGASGLWDGSRWLLSATGTGTSRGKLQYTTDSDGSSGWTASSYISGTATEFLGTAATDGSGKVVALIGGGSNGLITSLVSTDGFSTYQTGIIPIAAPATSTTGAAAASSTSIWWNGTVFVVTETYGGTIWVSSDGLTWNYVGAIIDANSGKAIASQSNPGANGVRGMDISTGKFISLRNDSTTTYSSLYTPRHSVSTQFCLPYKPGYYIKRST